MTHAATLAASPATDALAIRRPDASTSIFSVTDRTRVFIRAGTTIGDVALAHDTEVEIPPVDLVAGMDIVVHLAGEKPVAAGWDADFGDLPRIGGFHVAPGGNATARSGGDDVPAINPLSCWDAGFRPACADPRGMTLVTMPDGQRIWVDIYLLGKDHLLDGSSRHGVEIADGSSMQDGLNYKQAVAALAHHGKQLLTYDEYRVAAFGVTERSAAGRDPRITGLDAARTSAVGLMQATGNLWIWGTDGDPDDPRPSLFGGAWIDGSFAGSRYAYLDYHWPEYSDGSISARGRCDHAA